MDDGFLFVCRSEVFERGLDLFFVAPSVCCVSSVARDEIGMVAHGTGCLE